MAASSELCWCCGQPGRIATREWRDALCGWWCDACGVGWGRRDAEAILAAENARREAIRRDYLVGARVVDPASAMLLTGI